MSEDGDSKDQGPALGPGPAKVAEVIESAYGILDKRLREHATFRDGLIQTSDLTAVRQTVTPSKNRELLNLVRSAWAEMASIQATEFWDRQRRFPLERLLVQRFDHLLVPHGTNAVQGESFSRRAISGFLYALMQMVGEDLFEDYRARCKELIDETRRTEGDAFDWKRFYDNAGARVLVTDILVYIARYFDDVPKRRAWMIDIFERAMPPATETGEDDWRFGDIEFHMLLDSLYADLGRSLLDDAALERLRKRYGAASLRTVAQALESLKIDRRSVEATAAASKNSGA
ncbi:MAG: hypothetical protein QNJ84_12510 [Alphaproteobacteria bacterium]|nr:hypothetical protein [Alphaproteobacteria bacterium]